MAERGCVSPGEDRDTNGEKVEPAPATPARPSEALSAGEVRERAAAGVILLVGRSVVLRIIGLGSNVVLARLLVPADFGVVGLGLAIIAFGSFAAEAGLGAGLVRRADAPNESEMRAITGLQLTIASAISLFAASGALAFGGSGPVTALMMLSLPVMAFRTPQLIVLDRELDYRIRVVVEVVETVVYAAWAIGGALLGLGAWSIASATVVRVLLGSGLLARMTPLGLVMPSFDFGPIRPLLAFGARLQGVGALQKGHDLILAGGIVAIGGLVPLGIWTLAMRVLQIPAMIYEAIFSVSFPAFARIRHAEGEIGPMVQRSVSALAVTCGLVLAVVAGVAPAAIPLVFGEDWADAALIMPGACFALAISAPVNIGMLSMLTATGDAATALRATLVGGPVRLTLSLLGMHLFGVWALGVGWALGALSELPIVVPRAERAAGRRLRSSLVVPLLAATLAGTTGFLTADQIEDHLPATTAAAAVSACTFAGILSILDRRSLRDTMVLLRRAVTAARAREASPRDQI